MVKEIVISEFGEGGPKLAIKERAGEKAHTSGVLGGIAWQQERDCCRDNSRIAVYNLCKRTRLTRPPEADLPVETYLNLEQ